MKNRFLPNVLIILALISFFSACSKYDEGPWISLYGKAKRVQGRWYFSQVKYNDVDSTDAYRLDPIQTIEFYSNPEKEAEWSSYAWNRGFGATGRVNYGFWRFNSEMDSIHMITTMTVWSDGEAAADTVEYLWKINRLAYTEFWMERQADDTTKVTWKLWKLAY